MIIDPYDADKPVGLDQVIKEIVHYNDICNSAAKIDTAAEITIRAKRDHFDIPGYEPKNAEALTNIVLRHKTPNNSSQSSLNISRTNSRETLQDIPFEIDGWKPISLRRETVVFVTGFNSPAKWALESFGGMITLGGLASRIVPFVYKWNCGNLVDYWAARKVVYKKESADMFVKFLSHLVEQGFTKIHILCHSMGANLVCNSTDQFGKIFRNVGEEGISNDGKSKLGSITFLNPETPLREFREIHLGNIAKYTSLTTVYGSTNDVALIASEFIFSRKKQLGRHVNGLVKSDEIRKKADKFHFHADSDSFNEDNSEWNYLDVDVIDTTHLDIVSNINPRISISQDTCISM